MTAAVQAPLRLLPTVPVAENLGAHLATFGPAPLDRAPSLMDALGAAQLTGRGGAGFPAARKWQAVAERARTGNAAVVVGNGVETEPASAKDRTLLALRPHLVFDGLQLAAVAVHADRAVLCVSRTHDALLRTLSSALRERRQAGIDSVRVELVDVPSRYIAGEETALVARLNGKPAKPRTVPPRPFESGVEGRPTLVNNVETLAQAALVARGAADAVERVLVTVGGAVVAPGVVEVSRHRTVAEVVALAGGATGTPRAVLVGGYFGRWAPAQVGWDLPLSGLGAHGLSLGAGVVAVLPSNRCGIAETDRVLAFLARESARQCGPCEHGLPALSALFHAVAARRGSDAALAQLARWSLEIRGRGACRHPDGATLFAASALEVFADHLRRHAHTGPCKSWDAPPLLPIPAPVQGWR